MRLACRSPGCLAPATVGPLCRRHDFWSKVDRRGPNDCWPWRKRIGTRGYGHVTINGVKHGAHVIAYRYAHGPVPEGMQVDHRCHDPNSCAGGTSCRHRRCCNPAHLRAVTAEQNSSGERSNKDAVVAAKREITHCPAGHEYTPENTHVDRRGWRNCKKCRRISQANGKKKKRAHVGPSIDWLTDELTTDAYQDR